MTITVTGPTSTKTYTSASALARVLSGDGTTTKRATILRVLRNGGGMVGNVRVSYAA